MGRWGRPGSGGGPGGAGGGRGEGVGSVPDLPQQLTLLVAFPCCAGELAGQRSISWCVTAKFLFQWRSYYVGYSSLKYKTMSYAVQEKPARRHIRVILLICLQLFHLLLSLIGISIRPCRLLRLFNPSSPQPSHSIPPDLSLPSRAFEKQPHPSCNLKLNPRV